MKHHPNGVRTCGCVLSKGNLSKRARSPVGGSDRGSAKDVEATLYVASRLAAKFESDKRSECRTLSWFSRNQMSESLRQDENRRNGLLRGAKRVVIKLGTSTVTGSQGELSLDRTEPIVRAIATLQTNRRQVVLVSSGAVGLGRGWLGLHPSRLKDMVTKQACAARGQSLLLEAYKRLFGADDAELAAGLVT